MSKEKGTTELRFCTIDEIVDEINRRYTNALVLVNREDPAERSKYETQTYWHGSLPACAGLAQLANKRIMTHIDRLEPIPEDPDNDAGEWAPDDPDEL